MTAETFYLTGDIEKYGSGIQRIRNEILEYPTMEFNFQEIGDGFLSELSYKIQKTSNKSKDVTKEQRKEIILKLIETKKEIKTDDIAKSLYSTRRTILRDIEELKNEGKIYRIGGRKLGYWQINN